MTSPSFSLLLLFMLLRRASVLQGCVDRKIVILAWLRFLDQTAASRLGVHFKSNLVPLLSTHHFTGTTNSAVHRGHRTALHFKPAAYVI